jgi:hypothetical protein
MGIFLINHAINWIVFTCIWPGQSLQLNLGIMNFMISLSLGMIIHINHPTEKFIQPMIMIFSVSV